MAPALQPADRVANAISDAMNATVPWLWWPLTVPARDRPLPRGAHVLFAVHAGAIHMSAGRLGLPRPRPAGAVALTVTSWAWFTGAWNRRAAAGPPRPLAEVNVLPVRAEGRADASRSPVSGGA